MAFVVSWLESNTLFARVFLFTGHFEDEYVEGYQEPLFPKNKPLLSFSNIKDIMYVLGLIGLFSILRLIYLVAIIVFNGLFLVFTSFVITELLNYPPLSLRYIAILFLAGLAASVVIFEYFHKYSKLAIQIASSFSGSGIILISLLYLIDSTYLPMSPDFLYYRITKLILLLWLALMVLGFISQNILFPSKQTDESYFI
ncbi:MAG: hypothetical protein AAF462_03985 [Thermodesulfobacteriota bacterium]